jgi:hypothetical protein
MVIPDIWIEQGPIPDQYDIAGDYICHFYILVVILSTRTSLYVFRKPDIELDFVIHCCVLFLITKYIRYYDIAGLNEPHIAAKVEHLIHGIREHRDFMKQKEGEGFIVVNQAEESRVIEAIQR